MLGSKLFACLVVVLLFAGCATETLKNTKGRKLTGTQIRSMISGATTTFPVVGATVIVIWDPNGRARGIAGPTADLGKWWIEGDKLCQQWNTWPVPKACYFVTDDGNAAITLYYKNGDKYDTFSIRK